MIGSRISRYVVTRPIGEGGMGMVYQGVDEQLDRQVAIKILRPEYAQIPEVTARFLAEARAANAIKHSSIVQVYEFGNLPDGTAYMVMEYLDGVTLSSRLRDRSSALPEDEAVHAAWQIASALAEAHARGIVHRDLKPSNIMLIPDPSVPGGERAKLLDFGIAKILDPENRPNVPRTRTGAVIGTPLYMSPEQCRGDKELDGKSDVYSLGVVLFHMLAGRPPFQAEGEGALIGMHIYEAPPPLRQCAAAVSASIAALVDSTLAKDKARRPTMQALTDVLAERSIDSLPALSRRRAQSLLDIRSAGPLVGPPEPGADATQGKQPQAAPLLVNPSTIGLVQGQVAQRLTPQRQRLLVASLGLGALLSLGGVWLWQRPTRVSSPALTSKPRRVTITIDSTPSGAQVLRLPDNQVQGTTPWRYEQPMAAGQLALRLHLADYQDQDITVPLDQDLSRVVALLPPHSDRIAPAPLRLTCSKGYVASYKAGRCVRKAKNHGRTQLVVD